MKNWPEELVIKFAKDVAALSLSPFQVEDFIPVFLENNGLGEIQYEAPKGNLNEPVEDFNVEWNESALEHFVNPFRP